MREEEGAGGSGSGEEVPVLGGGGVSVAAEELGVDV